MVTRSPAQRPVAGSTIKPELRIGMSIAQFITIIVVIVGSVTSGVWYVSRELHTLQEKDSSIGNNIDRIKTNVQLMHDVVCRTMRPANKKIICPFILSLDADTMQLTIQTVAMLGDSTTTNQPLFKRVPHSVLNEPGQLTDFFKEAVRNSYPEAAILSNTASTAKLREQAEKVIHELRARRWEDSQAVLLDITSTSPQASLPTPPGS